MPKNFSSAADALRQALRDAVAALDIAETRGEPAQLSQALAHVGQSYRALGALADAQWYTQQGLRQAQTLGAVDAHVDALCELAEIAAERADALQGHDEPRGAQALRDKARDHGFEAARLASRSADPQWEITVLLRVSDLFDRFGDHEDAIALQCRAVGLMTHEAVGAVADESCLAAAPRR